jgi:hypothetical protein
MKYRKVRVDNQWESLSFFVGGVQLHPKKHKRLSVEWPDGHVEVVSVGWRSEVRSYSDHGHEYSVRSDVPYLMVEYHGARLELRLNRVKPKVAIIGGGR